MIYKDGAVRAHIPDPAAAVGHVEVVPQEEVQSLAELSRDEALQLFFCSSFAATALFETLGAAGTNIVVRDGDGVQADVYARSPDDGLGLRWEAGQADREQLSAVADKVSDAFWYIGKDSADEDDSPNPSPAPAGDQPPAPAREQGEDYRVKQLRRSP